MTDRTIIRKETANMGETRDRIVRLLYQHQDGATANLDTGNDKCRCGKQGDQYWRPHFADVLIAEFGLK